MNKNNITYPNKTFKELLNLVKSDNSKIAIILSHYGNQRFYFVDYNGRLKTKFNNSKSNFLIGDYENLEIDKTSDVFILDKNTKKIINY